VVFPAISAVEAEGLALAGSGPQSSGRMPHHLRIQLSCPDDRGLLAAVSGRLFELGGDVGDAAFSLIGEEATMSCVCAFEESVRAEAVQSALAALPALSKGQVSVTPFTLGTTHVATGHATHVIRVRGEDQPGLMARLAEGFGETGANVVRMDAERVERQAGGEYAMRFEIWIPEGREAACLADASNIAEQMGMTFSAEPVRRDR